MSADDFMTLTILIYLCALILFAISVPMLMKEDCMYRESAKVDDYQRKLVLKEYPSWVHVMLAFSWFTGLVWITIALTWCLHKVWLWESLTR
jgi:nitrate/nitrite transporter NarK